MKTVLLISLFFSSFIQNVNAADEHLHQANLRTGFLLSSFSDLARADIEVALQFWVNEISKQVGISTETFVYRDIKTMRNDFYKDKINFVVASPLPLVNKFDLQQLAEGYKIVWIGDGSEDLLLVTHNKTEYQTFKNLKSKHLSLLASDSISELYIDVLALENFNKKAKKVFKKISTMQKSHQLILNLFFNKTDAILVYKGAYELATELNPQIRKNTKIILKLPNIPRALGFFHNRVDPVFRERVLTEVDNLKNFPRGQQLLEIFKADRTVRSSLTDLLTTQQLKQRYEQLIN